MKELLDKYVPLLNKFEFRCAMARFLGDESLAAEVEVKRMIFSDFVYDIAKSSGFSCGDVRLVTTKGLYCGEELEYLKTVIADYNAE